VRRVVPGVLFLMVVSCMTARCFASSSVAAISGTVRDIHGTAQMGALIEVLRGNISIATALSDDHGRYIIPSILPGQYQMRATAAFFVPVERSHLYLQPGAQAVVNLTMSAIFEADNWLPAQRRHADEPVDDWKWTLRSTASRPLLRLNDPEDGVSISSSSEQSHRTSTQGKVMVTNGDGTFGDGGNHQALFLSRTMQDGDGAVFRADVGDSETQFTPGPSAVASAGYERRTLFAGNTRMVTSFQSHPELTNGSAANGFQVLQLASTQQISLGDMVLIDVGTLLEAEHLEATRMQAKPYVRFMARPNENVMVEYRYASGRELQSSDDLDRLKPSLTALVDANGRPLITKGSHQELSVSRKLGKSTLSFAGYTDQFTHSAISGSGLMDHATLQEAVVVADPTTGTFQMATQSYSGRGVSVAMMQALTPALSAWVEYDLGTALKSAGGTSVMTNLGANVTPQMSPAGSVALRGKIQRTGTSMRAEYRWQPLRTLTQVNAYNVTPDEAYMSFYLRQRLWCGRLLPQGVDAVVEATNLLEQGYQPVLAPDGQTLFLAQMPRAVQGGLAFNF
jgi:hypothetical protein